MQRREKRTALGDAIPCGVHARDIAVICDLLPKGDGITQ
jgi:hypothetical protein